MLVVYGSVTSTEVASRIQAQELYQLAQYLQVIALYVVRQQHCTVRATAQLALCHHFHTESRLTKLKPYCIIMIIIMFIIIIIHNYVIRLKLYSIIGAPSIITEQSADSSQNYQK